MQQAHFLPQGGAHTSLQERSAQSELRAQARKRESDFGGLEGAQGVSASFELVLDLVRPSAPVETRSEPDSPPPVRRERSARGTQENNATRSEKSDQAQPEKSAPSQGEPAALSRAEKGGGGAVPLSQLQGVAQNISPEELLTLNQLLERLAAQLRGAQSPESFLERTGEQAQLSSRELWALMNGWSQAQGEGESYLPSPELAQQAKSLLNAASSLSQSATLPLTQPLTQQIAPQALVNVQQAAPPSYLSARSLPSVTQLQLTEGQKEGLVRQIAEGFRLRGEGKQVTEIRLHPSELGMVRVKVELQGDQMRIWFAAEHASVSETIAQQIEQLRAALLEQEIQLADSQFFNNHEALSEGGEGGDETDEHGEDRGRRRRRRALRPRPAPAKSLTRLRQGRFQATI